jgi:CHAD domain-containing protein
MTLLQKRIRSLTTDLQKSVARLERDVTARDVHRLRTTIRRLESVIGYTNPDVGKKQQKALDKLEELRKRAGKVRDLDIQIGLMAAIANGSTANDRRTMTDFLKARRHRQAIRLVAELRELDHRVFPRLAKISEQIEGLSLQRKESSPLAQARSQLMGMARRAPARPSIRPARLHEMRISLKRIRYTVELAEESGEKKQLLEELKPVQDAIGEWHDWETLVATAEKQFRGRVNCPLLVEMRSLYSARFSSATSAVTRLFENFVSPESRKPSAAVPAAADLARPA